MGEGAEPWGVEPRAVGDEGDATEVLTERAGHRKQGRLVEQRRLAATREHTALGAALGCVARPRLDDLARERGLGDQLRHAALGETERAARLTRARDGEDRERARPQRGPRREACVREGVRRGRDLLGARRDLLVALVHPCHRGERDRGRRPAPPDACSRRPVRLHAARSERQVGLERDHAVARDAETSDERSGLAEPDAARLLGAMHVDRVREARLGEERLVPAMTVSIEAAEPARERDERDEVGALALDAGSSRGSRALDGCIRRHTHDRLICDVHRSVQRARRRAARRSERRGSLGGLTVLRMRSLEAARVSAVVSGRA